MAGFVYILCAVTSGLCATLLLRSAKQTGLRLLRWSGLAFVCFTAANVVLVIDLSVIPEADLFLWRNLLTLTGVILLIYGLIWGTD